MSPSLGYLADATCRVVIPLNNSCDDDAKVEIVANEKDNGDKKNWLSSTHFWNTNDNLEKVIIQGKVYWIRVKELDAWFPNFQEDDQDDLSFDEESQEGDVANKADNNESDVDRVSESSFMQENNTAHKDANISKKGEVGSYSEDPFNIYGILDGQKNNVCNSCSNELKFTPGFTPDNNDHEKTWQKISKILLNVFNLSQINSMTVVRTVDFHHNEDLQSVVHESNERRDLWDYLRTIIDRWEGDTVIMGGFNEVRSERERFSSTFNRQGAIAFNNFISSACLIDLPLEGYAFT
ncbi:hypothetical protein Tco_0878668 [Tanacetum coccineum]|uniref:RNA-directed DNA polymerase, eukaryota n=1 Tax=Tanacetum coccineum TaxID=301880 RepID=A0ABQ5C1T1_9ASTR